MLWHLSQGQDRKRFLDLWWEAREVECCAKPRQKTVLGGVMGTVGGQLCWWVTPRSIRVNLRVNLVTSKASAQSAHRLIVFFQVVKGMKVNAVVVDYVLNSQPHHKTALYTSKVRPFWGFEVQGKGVSNAHPWCQVRAGRTSARQGATSARAPPWSCPRIKHAGAGTITALGGSLQSGGVAWDGQFQTQGADHRPRLLWAFRPSFAWIHTISLVVAYLVKYGAGVHPPVRQPIIYTDPSWPEWEIRWQRFPQAVDILQDPLRKVKKLFSHRVPLLTIKKSHFFERPEAVIMLWRDFLTAILLLRPSSYPFWCRSISFWWPSFLSWAADL